MAVRRLAVTRAIASTALAIGFLVGTGEPVHRQAGAATREGAAHARLHRIELPGGAHLLLRREYRDMFRSRMAWGDGLILERAYLASDEGRDRRDQDGAVDDGAAVATFS